MLRHLRDSCHEWVAADVLAALAHCGGAAPALRGGLPVWAFPRSTSLRWARYLCPVLRSLLFSAYEDYLEVAVGACEHAFDALEPLFAVAGDPLRCSAADLAAPPEDVAAASEGGGGGGGGGGDDPRRLRRLLAHAAATGAVLAVKITQPLVSALGSAAAAARRGGGAMHRAASRAQRRLQQLHDSVAHLSTAGAS